MCAMTNIQKKKNLDKVEKMNAVPTNLFLEDGFVVNESADDRVQIHMMMEMDIDSTNISEIINNIQ